MYVLLSRWIQTLFITSVWYGDVELLENLALGKQAYQSGVKHDGDPSRAVDGGLSQDFNDGSCIHTWEYTNAFWEVDLGGIYAIDHVTIYNRLDLAAERLRDVELYIGIHPENYGLEGFRKGQMGHMYTFELANVVVGRWVRITRISSVIEWLTICEVQVYGYPFKYFRMYPDVMGNSAVLQTVMANTSILCGYTCFKTSNCVAANYLKQINRCDLMSSSSSQSSNDGIVFIKQK